jgi:hypothetical protein
MCAGFGQPDKKDVHGIMCALMQITESRRCLLMYLQNDVRAETDPAIVRRMAAIAVLHPLHHMVLAVSKVPDSLRDEWTDVYSSSMRSPWLVFDQYLETFLKVLKGETKKLVHTVLQWSTGCFKHARSLELIKHAKFCKGFCLQAHIALQTKLFGTRRQLLVLSLSKKSKRMSLNTLLTCARAA